MLMQLWCKKYDIYNIYTHYIYIIYIFIDVPGSSDLPFCFLVLRNFFRGQVTSIWLIEAGISMYYIYTVYYYV